MSADLVAIHEAIAAQIKDGIARSDVEVYWYPEPAGQLPKITVEPGNPYVGYFTSFGTNGTADVGLRIRVETNNQDGETAHKIMCELLSAGGTRETSSICDALMADTTARGTLATLRVISASYEVDPETYNPVGFIEVEGVLRKQGANA